MRTVGGVIGRFWVRRLPGSVSGAQAHVAGWLGVSHVQVSRIETGRSAVNDLQKLDRWTRALRIPQRYLWFIPSAQRLDSDAEQAPATSSGADQTFGEA